MALEFRSHRDDAWYHAHIVTSEDIGGDHRLRIKFANFGDDRDEFVNTKDLTSLQDLEDLRSRVRRLSIKLQDSECPKVEKGLLVCAAGSVQTDDGDDRRYYYDAIIDEVSHLSFSVALSVFVKMLAIDRLLLFSVALSMCL